MPRREDVVRLMFRPDIDEARAAWVDKAPTGGERARRLASKFLEGSAAHERLDFHSLRGTFVTRLARSGVGFATVQKLARHSTPTLLNRYATSFGEDEVRAIEGLGLEKHRKT